MDHTKQDLMAYVMGQVSSKTFDMIRYHAEINAIQDLARRTRNPEKKEDEETS